MGSFATKVLIISFAILIAASCSAGFGAGFNLTGGGSGSLIRVNSDTTYHNNIEVLNFKWRSGSSIYR